MEIEFFDGFMGALYGTSLINDRIHGYRPRFFSIHPPAMPGPSQCQKRSCVLKKGPCSRPPPGRLRTVPKPAVASESTMLDRLCATLVSHPSPAAPKPRHPPQLRPVTLARTIVNQTGLMYCGRHDDVRSRASSAAAAHDGAPATLGADDRTGIQRSPRTRVGRRRR